MKSMLLSFFFLTSASAFAKPCTAFPHACRIANASYTLSQIDGDYMGKINFPRLEKMQCEVETVFGAGERAKIQLPANTYVEINYYKQNTVDILQTVKYSTVYCDDRVISLGQPSKVLALYNYDYLNIDNKKLRLKVKADGDYNSPTRDQFVQVDSLNLY